MASTKITVTRGDTFNGNVASWQVLRDGAAVPITDYEIRLYVAPTDDKDAPVIDVNESDPVGNRVYSPASGIIYPDIDAVYMEAIDVGSYLYDLEITSPAGEVITVVRQGKFIVKEDIAIRSAS